MDQINFGILGYASIARRELIPAMERASNCRPYALASTDEHKCSAAKRAFSFEQIYDNYQALLEDPKVQAVYIPLPNHLHREWTIKAAQAGKHVLCEKPLATTLQDAQEMVRACQHNGVLLMEAFMYRFSPRTALLQKLLGEQAIGEIRHISSTFSFVNDKAEDFRFYPEFGGGSLFDVGCYPLNLMGMALGEQPVSIKAFKRSRGPVDFFLSALLAYQGGALCSLNCGFDAKASQLTQISGSRGSILMDHSFSDHPAPILLEVDGKWTEIPVPASQQYVLQVEAFSDAILGKGQPGMPLDQSLENLQTLLAILQAAEEANP